jgi:chemotaxis signal transduction protein
VLELRQRLGSGSVPAASGARIVVMQGDEGPVVGLLVDKVTEVLRSPEDEIHDAPGAAADCVRAICLRGTRFVSVLDPDLVMQRV